MNDVVKGMWIPVAWAACVSLVLLGGRHVALRVLNRWALKTKTEADNAILKALEGPSVYWCIAIGVYVGVAVSDLEQKHIHFIGKAINALVLLSITIAAANLAGLILREYIKKTDLPVPTTGITFGLVKGVVFVIGLLTILNVFGVSIAPMLTAMGVGGLAVALALQNTLANFFAGINILVEKSVRVGDFIRLETGQEGYVDDITWNTTRLRLLANNMVVIPNSKLAQSIITNYHLPEKRMTLQIPVSVSYASDPDLVERALMEVAEVAALEATGVLADPPPVVRFIPGFEDSSLGFTLVCHVGEFVDQYQAQHELRKRIYQKLKDENIEIPFPHRTVILKNERE